MQINRINSGQRACIGTKILGIKIFSEVDMISLGAVDLLDGGLVDGKRSGHVLGSNWGRNHYGSVL